MVNEEMLKIARKYTINGFEDGEHGKLPSTVDVMYLARAVMDNEARLANMDHEVRYTERALRDRIDSAAVGAMLAILAHSGANLPPGVVAEQAYGYADAMAAESKKRAAAAGERDDG